jgi:hypothetical protein
MTQSFATGLLDRLLIESLAGRLALAAGVGLVAFGALAADDTRLLEHFVIGWLFAVFAYGSAMMTTGLAWITGEARAGEFARTVRRLLAPLVWGVVAYVVFAFAFLALTMPEGAFPR